uniref:Uncharacterized protein n=1 Tax=Chrysotila carterae TaxID=13221 RepID=A0A7S4EYB1_CHRCT
MPCSSEPSYFNAVTDLHSQAPSPCQDLLATCSLPETIDAEPTFSTSEQVIGEDVVSDGEEAYNCFHSSSTMLSAPWLSPSAMSTLPELTTPSADELPLPLRIVFLDIDGVLCCNQRCFLEPDKMSNLKHIVQTTGACVVLTSNWRLFEQLVQELLRVFAEYKIQCIGATPMCGMITELVRPLEIRAWLRGFEAQLADDPAEKSAQVSASMQYVAIDDRQLLDEQGGDDLHGVHAHNRATRMCGVHAHAHAATQTRTATHARSTHTDYPTQERVHPYITTLMAAHSGRTRNHAHLGLTVIAARARIA